MSFFSRIFGHSQQRELKKRLDNIHKQVQDQYKPVYDLGFALIRGAVNCRDNVRELIDFPTKKERMKREVFIFQEFIFFFMHITMREAFVQLSQPQIEELKAYLGPAIATTTIDAYFAHWPEEHRRKMIDGFYDNLNRAELEYTQCTKLDLSLLNQEQHSHLFRALFMQLGSNVADYAVDNQNDVEVIASVSKLALDELVRIRLYDLIAQVKNVTFGSVTA
ncbi:MAG TPA: hypothetical protein VEF34_11385 [Syntrophobacteraceae bacterium]|nr:hypothetical protein [Syntrophobacteraceae bacterium]